MLHHAELTQLPSNPEEAVAFLVKLATASTATNPHISSPLPLEVSCDMELHFEDEGSTDSVGSLSFEGCEN